MGSNVTETLANDPPVVFIVDGDPASRETLAKIVHTMNLRCRTHSCAAEFFREFDNHAAGCLVLEVRLPDMSGLDVQRRLIEQKVLLPVVFVSEVNDVSLAVQAMREGAIHYLQKPVRSKEIWDAIQEAITRDRQRREQHQREEQIQRQLQTLTRREREVLARIGQGMDLADIAAELKVTRRAVELCRNRLQKKLQAHSPIDLFRYAQAVQEELEPGQRSG